MSAARSLVIVESPAKARTIAGFLGKDFLVESSIGHIRDLPRSAKDVPAQYKKTSWASLGVDVENGFKPLYIVSPDKKQHIQKLKDLVSSAKAVYLATDEDREGEAIAWHLLDVLKPKVPVKRMVFHEITRQAIQDAIDHPRALNQNLVDAQEARRILDRLYGYEVSPVLWKKVMPRLSAGRVQSVATRIIVDRERARMKFKSASFWDIEATFEEKKQLFGGTLVSIDGTRVAQSRDFDDSGKQTKPGVRLDEATARRLADALDGAPFNVEGIERKPSKRSPAAPFMTSTLQQEAGRKLKFSSKRAMSAAQRLYEAGYITYMRTDSTVLSQGAITSARAQILRMYGKDYLPKEPRQYTKKVKNAQEAHEAIRPAGDVFRLPEEVAREVAPDEAKLYELIWMRTIASQMPDSIGETVQVRIGGKAKTGEKVEFASSGQTITFPGFLRAYVEGSDDPAAELEGREKHLPVLVDGQSLAASNLTPKSHETQPPARFTEASLVQKLEELGVGRPSTYASIIGTIVDRGYVWRKGSALVPTFTAFSVVNLLEKHFETLVDYAFTAKMEDELDAIAEGDEAAEPWLTRFYFGDKPPRPYAPSKGANGRSIEAGPGFGLKHQVADRLDEIDARTINTVALGPDAEGRDIVVRVGKWGPYLQRGESTAKIPEDLPPDELTLEKAGALLEAPNNDRVLGTDPKSGLTVYAKAGRYGAYVQAGDVSKEKNADKPKTSSLLKSMRLDTLTLEDALRLLSLPRRVGETAEGKPIDAKLGPYGPYITDGKESRSLQSEEEVFTVSPDEARALLLQPKAPIRRAKGEPREPLKTLGDDPVSKKTIVLRHGKFGHYVTDGETNATLKQGDMPDSITPERAQELLQLRRDREAEMPPGTKPGRGRRGAAPKGRAKPASTKSSEPKADKPAAEKKAKPKASAKSAKATTAASPSKKTAKAKKTSRAKLSPK